MLIEELAQLNARIEQTRQKHEELEGELRVVEAGLETFSADRQRFEVLRDVCNGLDKLEELKAAELFWEGVAEAQNVAGHRERARSRVARFEGEINGILEKQAALQGQIHQCLDELDNLSEEVRQAYAREERRRDEYVVEREISAVPHRVMVMPWSKDAESERRFRRALLVALLFFFCFSTLLRLWILPAPVRPVVAVVPERLVSLLRKEPPKPEPVPERSKDKKKAEKKEEKSKVQELLEQQAPAPAPSETQTARKKAESIGVLAFKDNFSDLMDEIPVASLGLEARLDKDASMAVGQAQAQRSLVSMQGGGGGSGGIGNAGVSRNVGSARGGGGSGIGGIGASGKGIAGVGFARVPSAVADLVAEAGRPVSDGPGPGRTDEEIQIVFDRYKAALYRIYNKELRKNPTLRGKMLMRLTIEPGGEVSMCKVESTDLDSPELVAQIVERVQKFNFGPKEGVPKTTILYPIDFLPAG